MISRISGKVVQRGTNFLLIDIGSLCYEVLVPVTVMQRLDEFIRHEKKVQQEL